MITTKRKLIPQTLVARGEKAGIYRSVVYFDIEHPDYTAETAAPARIKAGSVKASEVPGDGPLEDWGKYTFQERTQADHAVVEVEWDGAHAVRLTRVIYFQGRVDIDLDTGIARAIDLMAFKAEVGPAVLRRLREGWFGEWPTDKFRTADGCVLIRTADGWTDGDRRFIALASGWPAEAHGEPLDGAYVQEDE